MNQTDEVKTRLTYETENDRYIWESPYMDVTMEDILDAFFGMMVSATWQPTTVIEAMRDFAEDHKYMLDEDDDLKIEDIVDYDKLNCDCDEEDNEFEKDVIPERVKKFRDFHDGPHFYA